MRLAMHVTGSTLRLRREQLGLSQAKLSELTSVPQHQLSAFELGKIDLSKELVNAVRVTIERAPHVRSITNRRKRYRRHQYVSVPREHDRLKRAARTAGNAEYLTELEELARRHRSSVRRPVSAVSLFSGCGGFSLGFSAAGFQMKGFLEIDPALRSIYRANFPNARELGTDITQINNRQLSQIAHDLGPVDVLIGGPPCQGFSLSGKRKVDDPRNALFYSYIKCVAAIKPKIAVLENVRLLTSMRSSAGSLVKDEILSAFAAQGYQVRLFEINAVNYGLPQHRERVLFLAIHEKLGIAPSIPDVTHRLSSDLLSPNKARFRTFGDACSDLPYLESGESSEDPLHAAVNHPKHVIEWLWDVKEGRSAHENTDITNRPPSGYNTTYKRQSWNAPASTVQTTFGMISGCRNVHPIATRSLTIREAARIQSFPDCFLFKGNLGSIRTGIGNAVPPLLAFHLARHIQQQCLNPVKIPGLQIEL